MTLSPRTRKLFLTAHVALSLGWLGADLVLLLFATRRDPGLYPAMALIGDVLLIPLSLGALVTGLVGAVGTRWGLTRHWWVLTKLAVTAVMCVLVIVALTPGLSEAARLGADLPSRDQVNLVVAPSVAGTLLLFTTVLSVFKPWGRRTGSAAATRGSRRPASAGR
ncbi:MAG: DUF2269 domain-containing protein [Hamadaea sp.]|nr:DUF2269 domain-containing protein [Hamadaea sp.]